MIIPECLRKRVLSLTDRGHQGIAKTKSLIRAKCWFPGIDSSVELVIKNCVPCQANSIKQSYEPLRPSPMPDGPAQSWATDFFSPLPDEVRWLVLH